MDPFTIATIATTAFSAFGQIMAGNSARKTAELDAFNIETEREFGKAQAMENRNSRMAEYNFNKSGNIATFSAAGRDIGSDRSVRAFMEKQKEIVGKDLKTSSRMQTMQSAKATAQAGAVRAEGRAAQQSAMLGALTTVASGASQYYNVKTSPALASSSAPTSSPRPKMRPY